MKNLRLRMRKECEYKFIIVDTSVGSNIIVIVDT